MAYFDLRLLTRAALNRLVRAWARAAVEAQEARRAEPRNWVRHRQLNQALHRLRQLSAEGARRGYVQAS